MLFFYSDVVISLVTILENIFLVSSLYWKVWKHRVKDSTYMLLVVEYVVGTKDMGACTSEHCCSATGDLKPNRLPWHFIRLCVI